MLMRKRDRQPFPDTRPLPWWVVVLAVAVFVGLLIAHLI